MTVPLFINWLTGQPQEIGTAYSFTQGSVLFAGASGTISQDNANLFWNDTNFQLSVGGKLVVTNGTAASLNEFQQWTPSDFATGKPYMLIKAAGNASWQIGLWDGTNNNGTIEILSTVFQVDGSLQIQQTPTTIVGASDISIGSNGTMNKRVAINMNGTTYWFPCSTTAF